MQNHSTYYDKLIDISKETVSLKKKPAVSLPRLLTITFQGITAPREDWYWPKTENEEEEDHLEEEEKEDAEEIVELTVCIKFSLFLQCHLQPQYI